MAPTQRIAHVPKHNMFQNQIGKNQNISKKMSPKDGKTPSQGSKNGLFKDRSSKSETGLFQDFHYIISLFY